MIKDNSSDITIRDATLCDVGTLVFLNQAVHDWHVAHFPAIFRDHAEDVLAGYFKKSLENPNCHHYLACHGPNAVGFVQTELKSSNGSPFCKPFRVIHVNIIVVLPEYRGKGIGELLMKRVQQLAESESISRIELNHWEGNESAERFFCKMGFRPYRHYLYAELNAKADQGKEGFQRCQFR